MDYYVPTEQQNAEREALILAEYKNYVKVYQSADSNPTCPWSIVGFAKYLMAIKCAEDGCLREVYLHTHTAKSFHGLYTEYCFNCAFWHEKLNTVDPNQLFAFNSIDGRVECYHLKDEAERIVNQSRRGSMLGFAGHWWHIQRLRTIKPMDVHADGGERVVKTEVVYTNNLWANGTVPERFVHRFLPMINAELRSATGEEVLRITKAHAGKE
jgi:hypothetical protein